jgi:hypothetical protein
LRPLKFAIDEGQIPTRRARQEGKALAPEPAAPQASNVPTGSSVRERAKKRERGA